MHGVAHIDEAGHIALPREMQEALHLVPGTQVAVEQRGNQLMLLCEEVPYTVHWQDGWPVYVFAATEPVDVVQCIRQDREEDMNHILGSDKR